MKVAERVPLLQEMDPQHRGQQISRPATFLARFGVVGLDQVDQRLPGDHCLHCRDKRLPLGLLLGWGQLIIREAELLLATHHSSPYLRLQGHSCVDSLGFLGTH